MQLGGEGGSKERCIVRLVALSPMAHSSDRIRVERDGE